MKKVHKHWSSIQRSSHIQTKRNFRARYSNHEKQHTRYNKKNEFVHWILIKNDNDRYLHTKSRRYKFSDERKKNHFYRSFRKNQIIDRSHTHLKLCLLLFCEFQIFVRRYQKKQIHESKSTMRFFELCKKNEQTILNINFRF